MVFFLKSSEHIDRLQEVDSESSCRRFKGCTLRRLFRSSRKSVAGSVKSNLTWSSVSRMCFWSLLLLFFFMLRDKRNRCLGCWRLKECKILCHYILLHTGPHCGEERTVCPGGAKLHYLLVLSYLEVAEVKKTHGL